MRDDHGALEVFLDALTSGDSGGAIERQEARGQQAFVHSDTLPRDRGGATDAELEALGFRFGDGGDDLFQRATLPPGWTKEPSDHSMWSYLNDDEGRQRAAIFYKAAFYDRSARLSMTRRFAVVSEPVGGYGSPDSHQKPRHVRVTAENDRTLWQSPEYGHEEYATEDIYMEQGKAWLAERFPDWESPLAHWNDPLPEP